MWMCSDTEAYSLVLRVPASCHGFPVCRYADSAGVLHASASPYDAGIRRVELIESPFTNHPRRTKCMLPALSPAILPHSIFPNISPIPIHIHIPGTSPLLLLRSSNPPSPSPPSTTPLKLGILFSTYSRIPFSTQFGVRCACSGLLLTSLNPTCGTCLAKSSCASDFIGENCFQNGCRSM